MDGWMDGRMYDGGGGDSHILMRTHITDRTGISEKRKKFREEYEDRSRTFEQREVMTSGRRNMHQLR
jgi:hypothetical protein